VDAISEQLFGKIIEPSWNSPEKITEQLIELAESYFPDDESSTNTTPSLPTV
jgi:hypothetical protein